MSNFQYRKRNSVVNCNSRVLFHFAIKKFSWCAPSGFRVRLPEPAPKELKARKALSKSKLKGSSNGKHSKGEHDRLELRFLCSTTLQRLNILFLFYEIYYLHRNLTIVNEIHYKIVYPQARSTFVASNLYHLLCQPCKRLFWPGDFSRWDENDEIDDEKRFHALFLCTTFTWGVLFLLLNLLLFDSPRRNPKKCIALFTPLQKVIITLKTYPLCAYCIGPILEHRCSLIPPRRNNQKSEQTQRRGFCFGSPIA